MTERTLFEFFMLLGLSVSCCAEAWTDPNPFDEKNVNITGCSTDTHCQSDEYCGDQKGCLSQATCDRNYCKCPPGRYGWRCQYATCESYDYCTNDGECLIEDNKHFCACLEYTSGPRCEVITCKEGINCNGNCNLAGTCECPIGVVVGTTTCKVNCTQFNPCKNGATCNEVGNSYTCKCLEGYHGPICATADCDPSWCINGICSNEDCHCFPGFYGQQCEKASCKGYNGCFDKGTCSDTNNQLRCICDKKKYAGTYCEFECNKTCGSNSVCGFDDSCYCDEGYYGEKCEHITITASSSTNVLFHLFIALLFMGMIVYVYRKRYGNNSKDKEFFRVG